MRNLKIGAVILLKARLKKGEDALYDSLDEKLIIIKQLNTGNAE
jgi:hypothetical protein